jgi:predicted hydrocarbon binding protein
MIPMDEVKLTKEELLKIKEVYREIMSYASIGLFSKNGEAIGESIVKDIPLDKNYFKAVGEILKERGWVKEIVFSEKEVRTKGSIETHQSNAPTCHLLRGIVRKIYENYNKTLVTVEEVACESKGDEYCIFRINKVG